MVRSQWLGAVVVGLAWTGLLWSQSPASPAAAPNLAVGATITVNETGKQPEQCQVQASWNEPNGTHVLQVRSLASGETITVMALAQPGVFRVYHWGQANTPPAGVPTAPATPPPAAPAALAGSLPQAVPLTPVAVPQPAPVAPRAPSSIVPVSSTPTAGSNIVPASAPPSPATSQATASLPILPQPRDASAAQATPAINPTPNNPTIALPAINTRSPQQPPPAQLSGNGTAAPPTPTAAPSTTLSQPTQVAPAPNVGPVSSVTQPPAAAPACGCTATAEGAPAAGAAPCGSDCCSTGCGKPSLWSRMTSKSTSCSTCPQTGCCASSSAPCTTCTTCPGNTCCSTCGKPSLWSRMFSSSGCGKCSSCCSTCPASTCPTCNAETPAAPGATPPAAPTGGPAVPTPEGAPHMPEISHAPTSSPGISDYRQSWGKVEPYSTANAQTPTTGKPNETAAPPAVPPSERLAPVAPTAAVPTESIPADAVPTAAAPPSRRHLFSRLRGNNPTGTQNAIPFEQVQGSVMMPPGTTPEGSAAGIPVTQGSMPVNMVPGTVAAGRRPLLPLRGPGSAAEERRPLLGRFRDRRSGGADPDSEQTARRGNDYGPPRGPFAMRPIEVDADAPNAFSPRQKEEKKDPREEERYANAFPTPPERMRMGPGVNVSLPPLRMPQPPMQVPQAPFTAGQNRPSMPMAADAGTPGGMANAFTPSWTNRPLPADLDNRPQLTNGFGSGDNINSMPQAPQAAQMAGANAFPGGNGGMMMAAGSHMPGYLPAADGGRQSVTAGYQPAAMSPSLQRAAYNATMPHMTLPASANLPGQALSTPQMLIMLRESLYPSQREWAAEQLSHLDWRREQVVVASLVQGAREDPAPAVRAACVHALGAMRVNTLPVVQTVQALQKDKDVRVRQEADETLAAVGASTAGKSSSEGHVERVGGTLPAE